MLAASEYERGAFLDLGLLADRVHNTGWPFYSGAVTKASEKRRMALRKRWNVPDDKLVATLFLSKLKAPDDFSSLETLSVRNEILSLVKEGLIDKFHLMIKLHPIENSDDAGKTIGPFFS